jgi:very-short-patch-repair endonuclease
VPARSAARGTTRSPRDVEALLAELGERQDGVVARAQLLAAGITPGGVERRVATSRLRPIHAGVYAIAPTLTARARARAAALACGESAVVSHCSAAALWGLPVEPRDAEVTVVGRRVRRPGIVAHIVRSLSGDERTHIQGIPVTSPERTILDLARRLDTRALERTVAEAYANRVTHPHRLLALLDRHPRRPGARRLRAVVAAGAEAAATRSRAERALLALLRRAELPPPEVGVFVEGYEVDFFWREERLVVEVDGFAYHTATRSFERDRRRDGALVAAGFRAIRVTWRQISRGPEAVVALIAAALALGRTEAARRES